MDYNDVITYPLITEKSTFLRETENKYQFRVNIKADKLLIKNAVKAIFDVDVLDCKIANVLGKKRKTRRGFVQRPSWKKATVKLKKGQKIPFFEGI